MSECSSCYMAESGTIIWKNSLGQIHKDDGPAIERADGSKAWFINGELQRIGGPAVELSNGDCFWFLPKKQREKHNFDFGEKISTREIYFDRLSDEDKIKCIFSYDFFKY